jgi:hypothetical protein
MMSLRILATAVVLLALIATARAGENSDIGYPSPEAALEALRKNPDARFSIKGGWTIVSLSEGGNIVMWSFTPKDHPAYPAAVKRIMSQKEGAWYLEMKILCGGTKADCDKLAAEFNELNERMKKDIREHHGT